MVKVSQVNNAHCKKLEMYFETDGVYPYLLNFIQLNYY